MYIPEEQNPMSIFLYALKAPESKRQYPHRFKMFLDFLKLEDGLEEQAKQFLMKARINPQWAQDNFIQFISFEIERDSRKEISVSTISNYYKATKLFCEMNDVSLGWKKIRRGSTSEETLQNSRRLLSSTAIAGQAA